MTQYCRFRFRDLDRHRPHLAYAEFGLIKLQVDMTLDSLEGVRFKTTETSGSGAAGVALRSTAECCHVTD